MKYGGKAKTMILDNGGVGSRFRFSTVITGIAVPMAS